MTDGQRGGGTQLPQLLCPPARPASIPAARGRSHAPSSAPHTPQRKQRWEQVKQHCWRCFTCSRTGCLEASAQGEEIWLSPRTQHFNKAENEKRICTGHFFSPFLQSPLPAPAVPAWLSWSLLALAPTDERQLGVSLT